MPGVRFVADSTADLEVAYRDEKRLLTVPLKVIFGEETLVDGVDVDAPSFYARMRASDRNPTTSQPTPAEFEAAFREAAADGSTVICTTMSGEMSGTHGAAVTARQAVPDLDVRVIDTRTVAIGHYAIVKAAVACHERGGSADDVVEKIESVMRRQRSIFTVATLEYLRRGGRIGGARALLGSVLNIKPVLQVLDGRIEPHDKVRTNQRALERIADELISAVGESGRKAWAVVGDADRAQDADLLAERVAPHCASAPHRNMIGPIVGCHAGPGVVGMSFHLVDPDE
jgi:DegV family protein with EDD domain